MGEQEQEGGQGGGERRRYALIGGVVLLLLVLAVVIPLVLTGSEGQKSTVVELEPSGKPATAQAPGRKDDGSGEGADTGQGGTSMGDAQRPSGVDRERESWWKRSVRSGSDQGDKAPTASQQEGRQKEAQSEGPPKDQDRSAEVGAKPSPEPKDEPEPKSEAEPKDEQPERMAKTSPPPKESVSEGELRYRVQVASYRQRANAEKLAQRLGEAGFSAGVERAAVDGTTYYRVLTHRVDSKAEAEGVMGRLREQGFDELLLKRKRM